MDKVISAITKAMKEEGFELQDVVVSEVPIEEQMVVPAKIVTDFLGTSDQKILAFPNPTTVYTNIIANQKPRTIDDYEPARNTLSSIMRNQLYSITKQIAITAFNLVNNPTIPSGQFIDKQPNTPYGIDYLQPVRQPESIFATRETLNLILETIDNCRLYTLYNFSNGIEPLFDTNLAIDYAFNMISNIYNACLNRVDSEQDIVYLNAFNCNLMDTLPPAYVKIMKDQEEIFTEAFKPSKSLKNRRNDDYCY